MGLLGLLRTFARRSIDDADAAGEAVIDVGGDDLLTAPHYSAPGVDARPLPGDYVAAIESTGRGNAAVVGYLDPAGGVAEAGEVRLYARDGGGELVVEVHLKSDGTVTIENKDGGSFEMAPTGDVTINGVVIDTDGNVNAAGEVTAFAQLPIKVTLSKHRHPVPGVGSSGAPTPGG